MRIKSAIVFILLIFVVSPGVNAFDKDKDLETFLKIDGEITYYADGGSGGIPILFVPGLGGDHTLFKYQLNHFRKSRRAIAVDLPGHYKSTPLSESTYSIKKMAATLIKLADLLKIDRFVLVGHSLGGAVITEAARQAPEKVAALIFIDPAGNVFQLPKERKKKMLASLNAPDYKDFMKSWFSSNLSSAKNNTKILVLEALDKVSQETLSGEYRALIEYEPITALKSYSGPMLSINRPKSTGKLSYHKLVPKIELVSLKEISHWFMIDAPDKVNRVMDDFLKRKLK
jgi:pimeloyl-ACP methyl ester carboxylesterase